MTAEEVEHCEVLRSRFRLASRSLERSRKELLEERNLKMRDFLETAARLAEADIKALRWVFGKLGVEEE